MPRDYPKSPGGSGIPSSIQLLQWKLGSQIHTLAITGLKTKRTEELHKQLGTVYNFFTFKYTLPFLLTHRAEVPIKDNWSHNEKVDSLGWYGWAEAKGEVESLSYSQQGLTFFSSSHSGSKRHHFGVCRLQHLLLSLLYVRCFPGKRFFL